MPRRSRRTRLLALALELGGLAAVLGALATVSWIVALALAGIVAIVAAQFTERLL